MRALLCAALLFASTTALAQETPKPLSIEIQPLGDRNDGVVSWVFFRFANPNQITRAGLWIEGSIAEHGRVPRNFRFPVPRRNDKFVWNNNFRSNGKLVRATRWSVLPDQRNELSFAHTFAAGEAEIDVRLILEADYDGAPQLVANATEKFTIARTNQPYTGDAGDPEALVTAAYVPEEAGGFALRMGRRKGNSRFVPVNLDVVPAVKRVEFWVENKKLFARNAPPWNTEIDAGDSVKPLTVRAIAYDAGGRYVDADALVLNWDDTTVAVRITHTVTPDGIAHFKLSVHSPKGTRLKSVALYADDSKLHEWDRPPYALSVPVSTLAGVNAVQAVVIDDAGEETTDLLKLR
jgi:hypothetical protein